MQTALHTLGGGGGSQVDEDGVIYRAWQPDLQEEATSINVIDTELSTSKPQKDTVKSNRCLGMSGAEPRLKELWEQSELCFYGTSEKYRNHYAFKELFDICYSKEWIPHCKKTFNR